MDAIKEPMKGVCPLWLKNPVTEKEMRDTLYPKAAACFQCSNQKCTCAIVTGASKQSDEIRTPEEILLQAEEYLKEFYNSPEGKETGLIYSERMEQVKKELKEKGTYDLTYAELSNGARLAWRNSARCIARMFWPKLEVFDCRHVKTTEEMAAALTKHVEWGLNAGNIRVGITVFPQRIAGRENFRMWNSQFFQYAGYKNEDGSITGDPQNIAITKISQNLGWKGEGTRFDILPLIVSAPNQPPHLFTLPKHVCMEVPLEHPTLEWFSSLGLKWYAMPAVADMRLDVGGIEFTGAPFNGWYTGPEIGTRNLCDPHRYNILKEVGDLMELDTSDDKTLWKDKAMVQINVAVLHSFQKCGASIVDHHSAADAYVKFMETEHRTRGGCPSDWVWLVPPISGALTPLYHQQMINYKLKPSYEYQEKAWKHLQ